MDPQTAQNILNTIEREEAEELRAEELREAAEAFEEKAPLSLYGFPIREPNKKVDTTGKRYDIKKLWSRHKEILNLDSLGYTHQEIADMLGLHHKTVENTLKSTLGQQARLDIRNLRDAEFDQMRDKVMELTWMALDVYDETFNQPETSTPKERRAAARDVILEMSGLRAPTQIQTQSTTTVLTAEELAEFKERGVKASRDAGKLIDIPGE